MGTTDYSAKAAAIVDDIIGRSDSDLGPEDRDPLRVVMRIAFEVQEFLHSRPEDADALDWTQDTVFSGCDSIFLARNIWHRLGCAGAFAAPAAGATSFPPDLNNLRQQLDEALRSVQADSLPWTARILAVNHLARLQLVFLGATLW
jgi:hypothetical protein